MTKGNAPRFLSVCSGIEAASCAWEPLGWKPLAFSEINPAARSVLQHHHPDVPLHGDFTELRHQEWIADADVLVGGTPCQAFSVAGLRRSLDDERGNLSLQFIGLANAIDDLRHSRGDAPSVLVWENVPGVLSTSDNAFGCFLGALVGSDTPLVPDGGKRWANAGLVVGPRRSAAWRILDAQFFGLAQRRRRVFVVAGAGDGAGPAAVLFEPQGVRGDTQEGGSEGKIATGLSPGGAGAGGRRGARRADGSVTKADTLVVERNESPPHKPVVFHPTQDPISSTEVCHCLGTGNRSGGASAAVAIGFRPTGGSQGIEAVEELSPSLKVGTGKPMACEPDGVMQRMIVRRLTARECERLQGFPDDFTLVPHKGKPMPDGPRYMLLGNSMAVPVMRWIGARIGAEMLRPKAMPDAEDLDDTPRLGQG